MNVTSNREITIYRFDNAFGSTYRTAISEKQQDGTWLNSYIPVWFRKGVELADRSKIKIKNAWLKPTKDMKIVLFVSEYEQTAEIVEKDESGFEAGTLYADEITLTDELPF